MEALQTGANEWLGLPLRAEPFVYVATDRPMNQVREKWAKMQIRDWESFPVVAALDEDITLWPTWQGAAKVVRPEAKLFIVEHWTRFIGSAKNDPGRVSWYMAEMSRWTDKNGYTIIGVCEENKAKQSKDRYEDPRQRLAGVAEWGHLADTVFCLDKANPKDPADSRRVLYVSDHNHAGRVARLVFDGLGRLVFDEEKTFGNLGIE